MEKITLPNVKINTSELDFIQFSSEQIEKSMHYRTFVHIQVAIAIITIVLVTAFWYQSLVPSESTAQLLHSTIIFYALPLVIAIFMVMWERGTSESKILGYSNPDSSQSINMAILQNTVEQTLLAVLAIVSFAYAVPVELLKYIIPAAWLFIVGRILFVIGYHISPMWRFYGYSINFYTSVFVLTIGLWFTF